MAFGLRRVALAAACVALASCASQNDGKPTDQPAAEAAAPIALPPPPPSKPYPAMADGRMMSKSARPPIMIGPPPGSIDRDKYESFDSSPVKSVAKDPVSTFSIDVDTAAYANVRRFLTRGDLPPKDSVRVEELINYFDYSYPLPKSQARPFEPFVALAPSPFAKGKTLLHVALQGYDVRPAQRPPLNLTLLLDVSGSMSSEDKLPLAKKAFRILLDELGPKDRVSIAVYAGAAGAVLEPTPGNDRSKILAAFDHLEAGGSTAGGEGLALAYALAERNFSKTAINRVILATDGDFNVGIADPERLQDFIERKRDTGIYLSVLGFGGGNYNDALMQRLAQKGNGVAAYVDTIAEARKIFSDQFQSALLPIADDVKIQVEFNPAKIAEYRLIGYETRQLNREDFSNDRVDAGEIGAGAAVTALYELTPVGGKTLFEPLRYQTEKPAQSAAAADEIAFLRVRWKPPGAKTSQLIERPITARDSFAAIHAAPEQTRWAAAIAGFGQLLRQDQSLEAAFTYESALALAQSARGQDPFGWRAEAVQLIRAAKTASSGLERKPTPAPRPY